MADLRYVVDIDTRNAQRNLSAIQTDITALGGSMRNLAGIFGVAFSAQQIVKVAGDFENLRTTLGILYKDANAGAAAFDNIKNLATQTAFGVEDLTSVYTKLLTAGIEPTNEKLRLFADVSSVAADSLGALQAITDLYARTTAGGLGLEDLNRLADRGIPVFQILADKMGLSRTAVTKFGQSADGAQKILAVLEKELQKTFGGASAARIGTLNQAMSNLGDSAKNLVDRISQAGPGNELTRSLQSIAGFIDSINVEQINNLISNIKTLVLALGGLLIINKIAPALINLGLAMTKTSPGAAGMAKTLTGMSPVFATFMDGLKRLSREVLELPVTFNRGLGGGPLGSADKGLKTIANSFVVIGQNILRMLPFIGQLVTGLLVLDSALKLLTDKDLGEWFDSAAGGLERLVANNFPALAAGINKLGEALGMGPAPSKVAAMKEEQKLLDATDQAQLRYISTKKEGIKVIDEETLALRRNIAMFAATQQVQMRQQLQDIKDRYGATLDQIQLDRDLLTVNDMVAAGIRAQVAEEDRLYEAVRNVKNQIEEQRAKLSVLNPDVKEQREEYIKTRITLDALNKQHEAISKLLNTQPEQIRAATEALERAKFLREKEREATQQLIEDQEEYNRLVSEQLGRQIEAQNSAIAISNDLIKQNQLKETQAELERAIRNMRGEDQAVIKEIYDLELKRKDLLEQIANIPDLTAEARLQQEQRVNAEIDRSRAYIEQRAAASRTEQDSYIVGWRNAFDTWRNNLQTSAEQGANIFNTLTRGFEDSMVQFVQTGKLSFKGLFNSLIAEATRAAANKLLMSIFGLAGGGAGNGGGGFFGSILSSFFGGFFANGGTLGANKFGIAGERGPELITGPATVTPLDQLSMAGVTNVTYNIQAVDASSFRTLVARDPEFIFNVTEQGRRSLPQRSRR